MGRNDRSTPSVTDNVARDEDASPHRTTAPGLFALCSRIATGVASAQDQITTMREYIDKGGACQSHTAQIVVMSLKEQLLRSVMQFTDKDPLDLPLAEPSVLREPASFVAMAWLQPQTMNKDQLYKGGIPTLAFATIRSLYDELYQSIHSIAVATQITSLLRTLLQLVTVAGAMLKEADDCADLAALRELYNIYLKPSVESARATIRKLDDLFVRQVLSTRPSAMELDASLPELHFARTAWPGLKNTKYQYLRSLTHAPNNSSNSSSKRARESAAGSSSKAATCRKCKATIEGAFSEHRQVCPKRSPSKN